MTPPMGAGSEIHPSSLALKGRLYGDWLLMMHVARSKHQANASPLTTRGNW